MVLPVSESLIFAQKYAPSEIQKPVLTKGLAQLAELLEIGFSSYYFEWHLSQSERTDVLCSLTQKQSTGFLKRLQRNTSLLKYSAWECFYTFLKTWTKENSFLSSNIPDVWLAFDFSEKQKRFEPPNTHFCIDRNFIKREWNPDYINRIPKSRFKKILSKVTEFFSPSIPYELVDMVCHCFTSLPADGEIIHLSFMFARKPWAVKLNMTVPYDKLIPFLKKIGWSGNLSQVSELIADFCPNEKRVKCNILLHSGVMNLFELELEYNSPLNKDPRRKHMLNKLREKRLASVEAKRAMQAWPGFSREEYTNEFWPSKFTRWLDIKISIDGNQHVLAKAYLGFTPLFSLF